ncbi:serine/threonine protein kinase [Pleodorina starrii]|nr:serine/threonine protein kinase [Pleodorina starrii]
MMRDITETSLVTQLVYCLGRAREESGQRGHRDAEGAAQASFATFRPSSRGPVVDTSPLSAARRLVGEALSSRPDLVAALLEWAQQQVELIMPPQQLLRISAAVTATTGVVPEGDLHSLQLLLHGCRACPRMCEVALRAGAPEILVELRSGPRACLALLALTAALEGVYYDKTTVVATRLISGLHGKADTAAAAAAAAQRHLLVAGPQTDMAIRRLADGLGLMKLSIGGDLMLGYVVAGTIAAFLRFYTRPDGPASSSRPPPPELLRPARLTSLAQLLSYHPDQSSLLWTLPTVSYSSSALAVVEGTPIRTGLLDGAVSLASQLLGYGYGTSSGNAAQGSRERSQAWAAMRGLQGLRGLGEAALEVMAATSTADRGNPPGALSELSPRGVLALMEIALRVSSPEAQGPKIVQDLPHLPIFLMRVLGGSHRAALSRWPEAAGGGQEGAKRVALAAAELLGRPLLGTTPESEHMQPAVISYLMLLKKEQCSENLGADLSQPLSLASRLLLSTLPSCVNGFIAGGGLEPGVVSRYLAPSSPPSVLGDALLLLSQVARLHREAPRHGRANAPNTYPLLARANMYGDLHRLLSHPDATVRHCVCNLLGNMCRHSTAFYEPLQQQGLLPPLVKCLADPDTTVRKFAAFAIGNAAFHSNQLYGALQTAICPLVGLLGDQAQEAKTRANAAGALGNLARHSPSLSAQLIRAGALRALMEAAIGTGLPGSQPALSSSSGSGVGVPVATDATGPIGDIDSSGANATATVSLFSLGNMCTHWVWRESLMRLGVQDVVRRLSRSSDPHVQRYLQRLVKQLRRPATGRPHVGAAPGEGAGA